MVDLGDEHEVDWEQSGPKSKQALSLSRRGLELERPVRIRSPRPGLEENGLSPAAVGNLGEGLRGGSGLILFVCGEGIVVSQDEPPGRQHPPSPPPGLEKPSLK